MRMWGVNTNFLCKKHLMEEHDDLHKIYDYWRKNKRMSEFINKGLVQLECLNKRHRNLVEEMKHRHYEHQSELPMINIMGGKIDVEKNIKYLKRTCPDCRKNIIKYFKDKPIKKIIKNKKKKRNFSPFLLTTKNKNVYGPNSSLQYHISNYTSFNILKHMKQNNQNSTWG